MTSPPGHVKVNQEFFLCFVVLLGSCLDYDLMLMTILMSQAWLHSFILPFVLSLCLCSRVNQTALKTLIDLRSILMWLRHEPWFPWQMQWQQKYEKNADWEHGVNKGKTKYLCFSLSDPHASVCDCVYFMCLFLYCCCPLRKILHFNFSFVLVFALVLI